MRGTKSSVASKKAKSKLSTLVLDSFPSGHNKYEPSSSTPSSFVAAESTERITKSLSSFSKIHSSQSSEKGKGKVLPPKFVESKATTEDALWVDKYIPETEAELAIHKRKVEDVRRWLVEAFDGGPTGVLRKYRRILALTGHAGTGKTAVLRVLAREIGFDMLEWRNSLDDNFSGDGDAHDRESLTKRFQAFLTRASSCRPLPLSNEPESSTTPKSPSRRIILLEDFPNILHAGTADSFHAALEEYITSPPSTPLVCVISDAGTRGEDPESDFVGGWTRGRWGKQALDVRSIIPPVIFKSPYFQEIQFNPVAPTLMTKALTTLLAKHFSTSAKSKGSAQLTRDTIQVIVDSAHGDIRGAVMALQFACVVQLPKGNKKGDARSILGNVTRREQSLALFHMLGKVLHNKRKGDPPNPSATKKDHEREKELDGQIQSKPPLVPHLRVHERRGSRVDVNALYADSPIDTSLFALYLHHNYTQFCNEIDECDGVCEWLSWIDANGSETSQAQQNPHQFHLLTLGVLHSLPSPVTRRLQKIYKPEIFDVLKKVREAEESVADVEEWLHSAVEAGMEGAKRWGRDEVVLELGAVLKALDACGRDASPRNHGKFTSLSFVHPAHMPSISQQMQELDENEECYEETSLADSPTHVWGGSIGEKISSGGWLETDDIQEF